MSLVIVQCLVCFALEVGIKSSINLFNPIYHQATGNWDGTGDGTGYGDGTGDYSSIKTLPSMSEFNKYNLKGVAKLE